MLLSCKHGFDTVRLTRSSNIANATITRIAARREIQIDFRKNIISFLSFVPSHPSGYINPHATTIHVCRSHPRGVSIVLEDRFLGIKVRSAVGFRPTLPSL